MDSLFWFSCVRNLSYFASNLWYVVTSTREQLEKLQDVAIDTLTYDDSESSRKAEQTVTGALGVLRLGG
jgi:hypothetical protein